MRKVLLVTLWGHTNIGNRLQNYALQTVLESLKFEVTNLIQSRVDYTMTTKYKFKKMIRTILAFVGVKRFKETIYKEKLVEKRMNKIKRFSSKYIKNPINIGYKNFCNVDLNSYSYAVTGSDQVWHNWDHAEGELEYFYLMFMPKEKRIAYAPSFGFTKFPEEDLEIHKKGLLELKAISCREEKGAYMIKELVGRDVPVVIDPTMLLTVNDWKNIESVPSYDVPERFMLLYFLGERTEEQIKEYERIQKENNLEIIDIFSVNEADYYMTGPSEFIWLVEHASFICTDSFHACAFSIIFHKQFRVFKRKELGFEDMFDRIEGLLCDVGLHNNIYGNGDVAPIEWANVDKKVREKIEESKYFLLKSLV